MDWCVSTGKEVSIHRSVGSPSDFVYCDPPYAGRFTDYFNSWDEENAIQPEDSLKSLPCPFVCSMWLENQYRKSERLHEAFSNYEIRVFSHFYHLGSTEKLRTSMTEALVFGQKNSFPGGGGTRHKWMHLLF